MAHDLQPGEVRLRLAETEVEQLQALMSGELHAGVVVLIRLRSAIRTLTISRSAVVSLTGNELIVRLDALEIE